MKVVILAGGLGTRLMEETESRPKPMVEIGGKPILWHIMKLFSTYDYNDFIICLGYKSSLIKEYFMNYYLYNSDLTIDLGTNEVNVHVSKTESFKITLIETGLNTNTAGRIKKIQQYIGNETFMLTYGDGLADININNLVSFHKEHKRLATLTTIQTPGRFGNLEFGDSSVVTKFIEKPQGDGMWINGGFFVLEPGIFKYLEANMEDVQWEKRPLIDIADDKQLVAYKHTGFWKAMDALRDRVELENLWSTGNAPWKIWK
jgi:glucose-1-phosphate cytidylyltransferase